MLAQYVVISLMKYILDIPLCVLATHDAIVKHKVASDRWMMLMEKVPK